jgi:hypothetical protein
MHKLIRLLSNQLGDALVSMSDRDGGDTGDEVDVSVALVVVQVLVFSLDDEKRLFVEVEVHTSWHVLVSEGLDFVV